MGAAPIIKNGIHKAYCKLNTKGETPIEKNIIVVDEQGKVYEATYPKRAKGLVKNGRARFVAENKICLACPPNENLEDNKMSENTNINIEKNTNQITAREILEQIKKLQEQLVSLKETQNSLFAVDTMDEFEDGQLVRSVNCELVESQLEAIKTVFHEREKTLNLLLDFYKVIYNDVSQNEKNSQPESNAQVEKRNEFLKFVKETSIACAGAVQPGADVGKLPDFEKIWKTVYLGE